MRRFGKLFTHPTFLAAGVLGATVAVAVLGASRTGAAPAPGRGAPTMLKNIKVLKNVPATQIIPLMRNINASLGVRCDFCHVINPDHTGFEKDDKPMKNVARQMMVMMNDLNAHQKILKKKATCFMCHHGRPEPETIAPRGMGMGRPGGGGPGGGGPGAPR